MDIAATKLESQIVIVGGGGAGLTAALAALEAGAKDVVILEKAPAPGGNTAQCAGMFAVDSPAQRRKGIEMSADEIFREKMLYANWRVDPRLVKSCIEKSGGIIAWLEERGMRFDSVIEFLREGQAPKVFHLFEPGPPGFIGKKIADTLAAESRTKGVRILCETAARKILTDENVAVSGVMARSGDQAIQVSAGKIILATGGFGANRELLNRFFPGHADTFTKNYPEMTGDGLVMAEEVGAVIDDNVMMLLIGPHHYPWSHCLSLLVRRPDILLVNRNGERYCDETIFLDYHTEAGNILSRQPGKICYGLLDEKIKNGMIARREIISGMEREAGGAGAWLGELEGELEAAIDAGTVRKADTLNDLAEQINADPKTLVATVDRYNDFCETGRDTDYLKEDRFLLPLRTAPFYAVLGRQGFDTTLGGIRINHKMEVMGRGEKPIRGLYATGDCASGWEFANYNLRHPGCAMTFALVSGYMAGQNAAVAIEK
jgi:fumarate reductase flavoprotein subunit